MNGARYGSTMSRGPALRRKSGESLQDSCWQRTRFRVSEKN
jgi:hypothetical protein